MDQAKEVLAARGIQMPHSIAVQADNTCREQRNAITLMFNAALTAGKRVSSNQEVFFVVGHTHNECDQRFVGVTTCLKRAVVLQTPQESA